MLSVSVSFLTCTPRGKGISLRRQFPNCLQQPYYVGLICFPCHLVYQKSLPLTKVYIFKHLSIIYIHSVARRCQNYRSSCSVVSQTTSRKYIRICFHCTCRSTELLPRNSDIVFILTTLHSNDENHNR